jgi:hypothetical protein
MIGGAAAVKVPVTKQAELRDRGIQTELTIKDKLMKDTSSQCESATC